MTSLSGQLLADRYQIEALIGRGAMADVYRGVDTMLARPVAVKVITERDDRERERFLREARAMARLNHPNIVAVYDAGRSDAGSYIVMELVQGRTLAAIPPAELTVHTALRHYLDILAALHYAHGTGVFHRDIKPANVMVLPNGSVKVMDFGLARNASEMSSATSAGEIVGTIAYLPPERFLGKPADARGDLYSVGIMLYETFTGVLPFKSETDDLVAVIFRHVNEQPVPPRTVSRAVPVEVERIILRLLEKDPERRYATADDVARDVQDLLGIAPPGTRPPEAAPQRQQAPAAAHELLRKTFGSTRRVDDGISEALAGMLAARKGDYPEALRAYRSALASFEKAGNELERAKTVLKYAGVILQKSTEAKQPDRRDVQGAAEMLAGALPLLRGRRLYKELEEGERILYMLQRELARLH